MKKLLCILTLICSIQAIHGRTILVKNLTNYNVEIFMDKQPKGWVYRENFGSTTAYLAADDNSHTLEFRFFADENYSLIPTNKTVRGQLPATNEDMIVEVGEQGITVKANGVSVPQPKFIPRRQPVESINMPGYK